MLIKYLQYFATFVLLIQIAPNDGKPTADRNKRNYNSNNYELTYQPNIQLTLPSVSTTQTPYNVTSATHYYINSTPLPTRDLRQKHRKYQPIQFDYLTLEKDDKDQKWYRMSLRTTTPNPYAHKKPTAAGQYTSDAVIDNILYWLNKQESRELDKVAENAAKGNKLEYDYEPTIDVSAHAKDCEQCQKYITTTVKTPPNIEFKFLPKTSSEKIDNVKLTEALENVNQPQVFISGNKALDNDLVQQIIELVQNNE